MANFDYYNFQIENVTKKINDEINFLSKNKYSKINPIFDYINYLKARIGIDKVENNNSYNPRSYSNKYEIKKMNMDQYVKDLDIVMFKRPWNKLKEFHKIMKINNYIDNLEYDNHIDKNRIIKNKEFLKKELSSGLKNKKFGKNKCEINYDKDEMKIISISCLYFDKKKGIYTIRWMD